jgi:hypothetical protein
MAGRCERWRSRRTGRRDLRQLRFDRNLVVTGARRGRTSVAFPCRRGQCGGTAPGWPRRNRGRRRAHRRSALPARPSPMPCWKAIPRQSRHLRCRPTAPPWLRHRGIRARGCGRSPAARRGCARGPNPKRQWRRVRSRPPHTGQRQLRSERPDLAAGRYDLANGGGLADTAQRRCGRRRRRDRGPRR